MSKQATFNSSGSQVAEAAVAASRQVWLAGLGAAAVARSWARNEAGNQFHSLVRRGSTVERRALQVVGTRAQSSLATAAALLRQTRDTATRTARAFAETATMLVPALRSSRTSVAPIRKSAAANTKRASKAGTTRTAGRAKRTTKKARRAS